MPFSYDWITYDGVELHAGVFPLEHQLNSKNDRLPDALSSISHVRGARLPNPFAHVTPGAGGTGVGVTGLGVTGAGVGAKVVGAGVEVGLFGHALYELNTTVRSELDLQSYVAGQLTTSGWPFGSHTIVMFTVRFPSLTKYTMDSCAFTCIPLTHCE